MAEGQWAEGAEEGAGQAEATREHRWDEREDTGESWSVYALKKLLTSITAIAFYFPGRNDPGGSEIQKEATK